MKKLCTSVHVSPLDILVDDAWEALPAYDDRPVSLAKAIDNRAGNCLHRSILIARSARRIGCDAMRYIRFNSKGDPAHFSNLVWDEGCWNQVTTTLTPHYRPPHDRYTHDIDPTRFYATFDPGSPIEITPRIAIHRPFTVIIPELAMNLYSGCRHADEYVERSQSLASLQGH